MLSNNTMQTIIASVRKKRPYDQCITSIYNMVFFSALTANLTVTSLGLWIVLTPKSTM